MVPGTQNITQSPEQHHVAPGQHHVDVAEEPAASSRSPLNPSAGGGAGEQDLLSPSGKTSLIFGFGHQESSVCQESVQGYYLQYHGSGAV